MQKKRLGFLGAIRSSSLTPRERLCLHMDNIFYRHVYIKFARCGRFSGENFHIQSELFFSGLISFFLFSVGRRFRAWCKSSLLMMIWWPFAFRLSYYKFFRKKKRFFLSNNTTKSPTNVDWINFGVLLAQQSTWTTPERHIEDVLDFFITQQEGLPWRRAWWLIGLVCKSMPLTIFPCQKISRARYSHNLGCVRVRLLSKSLSCFFFGWTPMDGGTKLE